MRRGEDLPVTAFPTLLGLSVAAVAVIMLVVLLIEPDRPMGANPGTLPRDSGLQPERTRPAWRRRAPTYTVVAVLAGRHVVRARGDGGGRGRRGVERARVGGVPLGGAPADRGAEHATPVCASGAPGGGAAVCVIGLAAFGVAVP